MYKLLVQNLEREKIRGGAPLGNLEKMWSVRKKNQKNIVAPDPQFLFYNLKVQ
jgi:hypothetical protein